MELVTVGVEVGWIQPFLKRYFPAGPFFIRHRVPGGIAVPALDDHVFPEYAFKFESEAKGSTAAGGIQRIAFPFVTTIAKIVEGILCH